MTDKEAYELLLKYCGGEKGISMIKEMIHILGVNGAVEKMIDTYNKVGKKASFDYKLWLKQSFEYLNNKTLDKS